MPALALRILTIAFLLAWLAGPWLNARYNRRIAKALEKIAERHEKDQ